MNIKVDIKYENKCLITSLKGELDHHTASEVKQKLQGEIKKDLAKDIVLDLKDLKFMDSSGIGVILGRFKEIQNKGGKLAISGMNGTVDKIFTLSGLQKIISRFDDTRGAIAFLKEEK